MDIASLARRLCAAIAGTVYAQPYCWTDATDNKHDGATSRWRQTSGLADVVAQEASGGDRRAHPVSASTCDGMSCTGQAGAASETTKRKRQVVGVRRGIALMDFLTHRDPSVPQVLQPAGVEHEGRQGTPGQNSIWFLLPPPRGAPICQSEKCARAPVCRRPRRRVLASACIVPVMSRRQCK